jgi:Lon protease-like protein
MLSRTIPIFPLPNVVLFPQVCLPLHIFEPRYRSMVADALQGDRLIGIVLLRPGWEHDYEGRPAVYAVGCTGLITHSEVLSDGRYNIVLQGIEKFRILGELDTDPPPYRRAAVEPLLEPALTAPGQMLRGARQRLEALVAPAIERSGDLRIPPTIPDVELVNALAQYLPLEPVEKQALLERDGIIARCESLIELLEMKAILHKACASSKLAH